MFKKKFDFIKENKNKIYFFIVSRNRYLNDLGNIFGSIILNKIYKANPIVILDKQHAKINLFNKLQWNPSTTSSSSPHTSSSASSQPHTCSTS